MSVVVTVFSSVGGRAFSAFLKLVTTTDIFHYFFLRFQYKNLQVFLPTAASVKISKIMWNSVKWRQRFGKISVYHLYQIFSRLNLLAVYHSLIAVYTIYTVSLMFHLTNAVFQILCVCFLRSNTWPFWHLIFLFS